MTDTQAMTRYARTGDPDAFGELVDRYGRLVLSTCRRVLADEDDAQDAAQETFLKLAKSAGSVRSNVAAWLHRAATTTCLDMMRREARRRKHERTSADEAAPPQAGPDEVLHAAELAEQVDAALGDLDDDARELLVRRFLLDRTQASLAAEQGVSEATVSRRVAAALEQLRAALAKRGVTATTAALAAGMTTLGAQTAEAAVPAAVTATLSKVGMSGVGAGAGAAGMKVAIAVAAALTLATVGGIVLVNQPAPTPPTAAAPAMPANAWNPTTVLPLAFDGWWQLPGGTEHWTPILSIDAFRGEITVSQTGGAPSPGHVTYRYDPATETAEIIESTIDPAAVGERLGMSVQGLLDDQSRFGVQFDSNRDGTVDTTLLGERIGPARVFVPTGLPPDEHPRLRSGVQIEHYENASLNRIVGITTSAMDRHRGELQADLPTGGYDVHIEMDHEQPFVESNAVRPLLHRALLREFGISIRREPRMMDVYLLQLPEDGGILLEATPEGDPNVGGIELIGDDRVWLGHDPGDFGKYIEQWLDRPVVNDTGLESHGWKNAYRYAEPYPHPPGHDPVAHFLEQSGLRLVPGQREVEVTIVEQVDADDPADAPTLTRPVAVELHPYELAPLDAQLDRLPESTVDVEDLTDLQGFWEYTEGTLVRDLHIVGDLVLIPGTGQPWLDALAGWPEEVRALVKPRTPRVERALRVLEVQPTAAGVALTVTMDATGRPFYMLIDAEDDQMQMMMGSAPAELTFEGEGVRTARLHRVGPSPLADAVAATTQE